MTSRPIVLFALLAACGAPLTPPTAQEAPVISTAEVAAPVPKDEDGRPAAHALVGAALPPFEATTADGRAFSSDALTNWTVIRVWGAWCHDSRQDADDADRLALRLSGLPAVDYLTIHTPQSADHAAHAFGRYDSLDAYFASRDAARPATLVDADASLRDRLRVEWTPSYLVVGPDGVIRGFRTELSLAGEDAVDRFVTEILNLVETHGPARIAIGQPGGVGPGAPFNAAALRRAYPGYEIVSGATVEEGVEIPVLHVAAPGRDADIRLTMKPDWTLGRIIEIETRSAQVTGPLGERIGVTRLKDLDQDAVGACSPGEDDAAGGLVCTTPSGDFQRMFDGEGRGATLAAMRHVAPAR